METESYINFPKKAEPSTNEVYEYDSSATPKRVTTIYQVSYANDNSKDVDKFE